MTEAAQIIERLRQHRVAVETFDASKYRCLGAFVLVKRLDVDDELTPGGIVKPDIAKMRSHRGEVITAGPGEHQNGVFVPVKLKAGDKIVFTRYGGTDVDLDGHKFTLVHISQVYLAENS